MWVRLLAEVRVGALRARGRILCRWGGLRACSGVWAHSVAAGLVVWVVWLLVGGRLVRVHGCWWGCWLSFGSSRVSGLPAGGRLLWCWGGLFECSRLWAGLLAVV